jgi:hypothetical protein
MQKPTEYKLGRCSRKDGRACARAELGVLRRRRALCKRVGLPCTRRMTGSQLCRGLERRKHRLDYGQGSARVCGHDRGMLDWGAILPARVIDANICCTRPPIRVCARACARCHVHVAHSAALCACGARPGAAEGPQSACSACQRRRDTRINPPRLVWG